MHATTYTATADHTRTTVTVYRDGDEAPERFDAPFPDDTDLTDEDAQRYAERMLSARGLVVTSGWDLAPDPDRPGTRLMVWRADVAPAPALV